MVQDTDGRRDEGSGSGERAREVTVTVDVIAKRGRSVVVQYTQGKRTKRMLVPDAVVSGGKATLSDLEAGIPFSIEWGEALKIKVTSDEVTEALRGAGIWTVEDAYADPGRFQQVIHKLAVRQAVVGLAKLRQEATNGTG